MTLPAQDIVERLRSSASRLDYAGDGLGYYTRADAFREREAADTISRLTADNEALRTEAEAFRGKMAEARGKLMEAESRVTALETEIGRLQDQILSARAFVERHPALTLIDLAEFEAFLKVAAAINAALANEEAGG